MDKELFELCKEVVERTEWGGTDSFYCSGNITHRSQMNDDDFLGEVIPLYTSDYLLEKLPYKMGHGTNTGYLRMEKAKAGYACCYMYSDLVPNLHSPADTPLKALLKLTLALHEAGELS